MQFPHHDHGRQWERGGGNKGILMPTFSFRGKSVSVSQSSMDPRESFNLLMHKNIVQLVEAKGGKAQGHLYYSSLSLTHKSMYVYVDSE